REFHDPIIEKADDTELFRDRYEMSGRDDAAVGLLHAYQTFVDRGLAGHRVDDRLIGDANAFVVEGRNEFVGDVDVAKPRLFAFARRRIDDMTVTQSLLGSDERLLGARQRLVDARSMPG